MKRILFALVIGFGLAGAAYVLNTGGQSAPSAQTQQGTGSDPYRGLRIQ